jgi:hypothetical protein
VNIGYVTALPDPPEPTVIPVQRALTANQAQMELPVETALPEAAGADGATGAEGAEGDKGRTGDR